MVLSDETIDRILEENNLERITDTRWEAVNTLKSTDVSRYQEGMPFYKFQHSHDIIGLIVCIRGISEEDRQDYCISIDSDKIPGSIDIVWTKNKKY